jgi:hypothetical protein
MRLRHSIYKMVAKKHNSKTIYRKLSIFIRNFYQRKDKKIEIKMICLEKVRILRKVGVQHLF